MGPMLPISAVVQWLAAQGWGALLGALPLVPHQSLEQSDIYYQLCGYLKNVLGEIIPLRMCSLHKISIKTDEPQALTEDMCHLFKSKGDVHLWSNLQLWQECSGQDVMLLLSSGVREMMIHGFCRNVYIARVIIPFIINMLNIITTFY